jgi:hypothetical protein
MLNLRPKPRLFALHRQAGISLRQGGVPWQKMKLGKSHMFLWQWRVNVGDGILRQRSFLDSAGNDGRQPFHRAIRARRPNACITALRTKKKPATPAWGPGARSQAKVKQMDRAGRKRNFMVQCTQPEFVTECRLHEVAPLNSPLTNRVRAESMHGGVVEIET